MPREYRLYLRDMADAAHFIEEHTTGVSFEELMANEVLLRAVLHSLTIIGEAAKHIPDHIRDLAPTIPWSEIAGARDIIVHGYYRVNRTIIWNIIVTEIAPLREHVATLLEDAEDSDA